MAGCAAPKHRRPKSGRRASRSRALRLRRTSEPAGVARSLIGIAVWLKLRLRWIVFQRRGKGHVVDRSGKAAGANSVAPSIPACSRHPYFEMDVRARFRMDAPRNTAEGRKSGDGWPFARFPRHAWQVRAFDRRACGLAPNACDLNPVELEFGKVCANVDGPGSRHGGLGLLRCRRIVSARNSV